MDFPHVTPAHLPVITSASAESIGIPLFVSTTFSTARTPASRPMFIPFALSHPYTVNAMFVLNGSTIAGNIDLGIYQISGERIVRTGATASSGVSVVQSIAVTSTRLDPGAYYMAITHSSAATTTVQAWTNLGNTAATGTVALRGFGVRFTTTTQATLPATATFATAAFDNYVPWMGFTSRTSI